MKQETLLMFDLDGTLWDSAQAVAESWNEVFQKWDPSLPDLTAEDVHGVMGLTMKEISEVLQPMMKPDTREQIFEECCRHEVDYLYDHPGMLYPRLRKTLEELRGMGFELAIVSNCQRGYVDAFLHSSGVGDLFLDYEEWERTGLAKGKNIRLVMERNGYGKGRDASLPDGLSHHQVLPSIGRVAPLCVEAAEPGGGELISQGCRRGVYRAGGQPVFRFRRCGRRRSVCS